VSLDEDLARRIMANGPMTLAEFMGLCLMHPEHGYYVTRDPLGARGDFITAPEISQMFGELIGLSLAQAWLDQGAPARIALVELGPGRGTLMADMLRATKSVPGFHAAAELHLIEASPHLRTVQQATLKEHALVWHDSIESLPDLPLFLVANEFFDALPIRQLVRRGDAWCERCIGLRDGLLGFGLSEPKSLPLIEARLADTKEGDIVEVSPVGAMIGEVIGRHIANRGGAALIVDYGDWGSQGDTFQAVRDHAPVDPLSCPGQADLTAHVDFEVLARSAPCAHSRLTAQGVFLERLGITARAQVLAEGLTGDALAAHIAAHRRLTHPDEMGTLFKVLGLFPDGEKPPPGLDP
jgi:SAM-dependent MidA family methyltransferase